MINTWNTIGKKKYGRMRKQHAPLRDYLHKLIKEKNIKSILEVGCGLVEEYKKCVEIYQAIDINELTNAIHEDFTKLGLEIIDRLANRFDLLLASAVVEHCESGYRDFIKITETLNAKYSVISFFNGLKREEEYFTKRTNRGIEYPWNKYSQKKIEEYLKELGIANRSEIIRLSRHDTILIIKGKCY